MIDAVSNAKLYKAKGRGKSPEISIKRDRNAIPKGESWTWATTEMKESPAWRAMPLAARQVVDRIEIEHGRHGGCENGKLPVTWDDFEAYGIRRKSVAFGILVATALGWIDVTERGHRGAADERRAARYALTWVDRFDGAPRSNRWKRIETLAEADAIVAAIRDEQQHTTEIRRAARKAEAATASTAVA